MAQSLNIGTAGGNKAATEIWVGTSGGNKQATEGWVGTASGNKQFYASAPPPPLSAVAFGGGLWSGGPGAWTGGAGVSASGGTGSYSYQWHTDYGSLSGDTTDSVTVSTSATIPSDANLYCTVSDGLDNVNSNTVTVSGT